MLQPIETIIFDLDGTLRHNRPSADDMQHNFLLNFGLEISEKTRKEGARWVHYYWAQSTELLTDLKIYGEMKEEFWSNYFTRYLRSLNLKGINVHRIAPLLSNHMNNNFTPQDHVYPCVHETLSNLKTAGYYLGLVSNRSNPCNEQCKALGLFNYFNFAYVAAEVDAWKPDPHIFDRAFSITGSAPEKTIYIGDNYFADVKGAMNAGIQPILYDPLTIFPEAPCPSIMRINELIFLLEAGI